MSAPPDNKRYADTQYISSKEANLQGNWKKKTDTRQKVWIRQMIHFVCTSNPLPSYIKALPNLDICYRIERYIAWRSTGKKNPPYTDF